MPPKQSVNESTHGEPVLVPSSSDSSYKNVSSSSDGESVSLEQMQPDEADGLDEDSRLLDDSNAITNESHDLGNAANYLDSH